MDDFGLGWVFFKQNLNSHLHSLETVPVSVSSKLSLFQEIVKSLSVKVYLFLTRNKETLPTKQFFYLDCAFLFSSPGAPRQHEEAGGDGSRRAVLRVHAQVVDKLPTATL